MRVYRGSVEQLRCTPLRGLAALLLNETAAIEGRLATIFAGRMHVFVPICNMARTSIRPTARKCIDASGPGTSYIYVFLSRAVVWRYVRGPDSSVGGSTPCSLKTLAMVRMFRVGNAESYVFGWMLGSLVSLSLIHSHIVA